jgi:nucleotide-binding universal stress UspA family protein
MAARPRRILVGYDGSSASRRALDAVADLAGYGSTVAVVAASGDAENAAAERRRLVDEARDALLRRHVVARCIAADGDEAESLVEAARDLDVDLIVVARPSAAAASAVDRAECDVLLVA